MLLCSISFVTLNVVHIHILYRPNFIHPKTTPKTTFFQVKTKFAMHRTPNHNGKVSIGSGHQTLTVHILVCLSVTKLVSRFTLFIRERVAIK